jgi:hypothetical protein
MGHDDADLADLAGLAGAVRVLRRQVEELRDGGSGVVVPWIPVVFCPVRAQDLAAVTSHTFETAWEARFTKLYPLVGLSTVQGYDFGAAEVVATDLETRLDEVVDTWPVSGAVARCVRGPYELADDRYPDEVRLAVRYRRVEGAGPYGCPWWTPRSTRRTEVLAWRVATVFSGLACLDRCRAPGLAEAAARSD